MANEPEKLNISQQNLIEGTEIANGILALVKDPTMIKGMDAGKLCGIIVGLIMSAAKLTGDNERNIGAELGRVGLELATAQAVTDGKISEDGEPNIVYNCLACDKRIPKFSREMGKKYCGGVRCDSPEHKPS